MTTTWVVFFPGGGGGGGGGSDMDGGSGRNKMKDFVRNGYRECFANDRR